MKLSYQWLKQYVDLPDDLSMDQLSYDLTMRTVEVEGIEDLREKYQKTVVGKINSVEDHPHADKLLICQVDVGEAEDVQIVCGGSNLAVGQSVAVTLPGAKAIWHGEGAPVVIEETEIRGVKSHGMICGADELQLSALFPVEEDHQVIDLGKYNIQEDPGTALVDALGLDDYIIEIDNKSLTHRPDLWGHYGIARELAAIYKLPLRELPALDFDEDLDSYPVRIEKEDTCSRFIAVEYENIDARKSPLWLQAALLKVDVKPINLIVDITNYVMMTTGQPTHAYDEGHVAGGIVVRGGKDGEELTLLDGEEISLASHNMVIADEEKAIGLAGVMGGARDSILDSTENVVFEVANFDAQSIRKTAQEYGVRTEASSRFEKGIDSQRALQTILFANQLIADLFPEAKAIAYEDALIRETEQKTIDLSISWLSRRLGMDVDFAEVKELLEPLGFEVAAINEDDIQVLAPSFRSTGDISLMDDILEEVARMIGYENFELQAPAVTLDHAIYQKDKSLNRRIRDYLAFSCQFQEIFTYPWIKDEYIEAAGIDEDKLLKLAQPPAPDQNKLRSSLVPGLLEAGVKNIRYYDDFRIFELTQVFDGTIFELRDSGERLPAQEKQLGAACVGTDPKELFFQLKGVVESLPLYCQIDAFAFKQVNQPSWADNKAWLEIFSNGEKVGELGLISMVAKVKADLKHHDMALFILNVDKLKPFDSRSNTYYPLPLYPHVEQDISILVDENMAWETVKELVAPLVYDVRFIDEYRGKQTPEGKKSLTLRVEIASDEGTLTNEEIEEAMNKVLESLRSVGTTAR